MQDFLSTITAHFGRAAAGPGIGTAEFFVAVLVACGLIMIAVSSLLPKDKTDNLEWWER